MSAVHVGVSAWIESGSDIASTVTRGYSALELGSGQGRVDLFLGHTPQGVVNTVDRLLEELSEIRMHAVKNMES